MPLETVWADQRLDTTRRRVKADVATGYVRFQSGDILCPKVTPTFQAGRSAIMANIPRGFGAATTEVHVVRSKPDRSDPRFVRYALLSKRFLEEGVSRFQGVAGLQRVPDSYLRDFHVKNEPLEEQRRIADFLDDQVTRIDQAIQLRQQQIDLVHEHQASYLRDTTTVWRGKSKPTGVAWMPKIRESWRLSRIGLVFTTGSGSTPPSDDRTLYGGPHPWLLTGDLNDGLVIETKNTLSDKALMRFGTLAPYPSGSLVVAMYGATIGRLGILGAPASVNQACCVLTRQTVVQTRFAFYWFLGHRQEILQLGTGAGQPNISQELVRSLLIPVAPWSDQKCAISDMESSSDAAGRIIHSMNDAVRLLMERKRSLITAAVTGEFDVSSASSRAAGLVGV